VRHSLSSRLLGLAFALVVGACPAAADPPAPAHQGAADIGRPAPPQPRRVLDDALKALAPQRPGVHDLYFVGFAPFGDQDVFRKEAERVRALFDERFGTRGRSLILINSPDTVLRYPRATVDNLQTALAAIGRRIDAREDVVFLFVTSHGEPDRGVIARLNGRDLGSLTPPQLAQALSRAGIQNRVVLISACFSGQFVDALAGEGSLVMTAAAANRMSFGCTTDAEWTWFGESYFVQALPKLGKFVPAFAAAKQLVANKEMWEQVPASQPQISAGTGIERLLEESGY
jgi:hypothetical protein